MNYVPAHKKLFKNMSHVKWRYLAHTKIYNQWLIIDNSYMRVQFYFYCSNIYYSKYYLITQAWIPIVNNVANEEWFMYNMFT